MLPPTEPERRAGSALEEKLAPMKDRALEVGQEIKSEVQDAARQGAEHVKETAGEAVQHTKEDAAAAGEQVRGQAQQRPTPQRHAGDGSSTPIGP
jgi:hypothetical protein